MEPQGGTAFEFGAFRFDPAERVLYRGPERVPLSPKVADTLLVLLTHHGRVVEKNELMQLVWPDTFVEEGGLARNISALRKALGDDAEGSRHIETIPKRGYRFVAPLGKNVVGKGAAPRRRGVRFAIAAILVAAAMLLVATGYLVSFMTRHDHAAPRVKSIAVLPLKNISGDAAQDYFAEGMTEVIATELSKTGLPVIAPASVRSLRPGAPLEEVGRQLKVEAVIRGTVLQSGDRVRINAQLVDIGSGRLLWADSYQRDLRDVLQLQAEVAGAIARQTSFEAASGERPAPSRLQAVVPDAYQAYLRGRFFWNKRTEPALRKAVEYFNEAIAKDGTYAPAYAGLADSWSLLASNSYDAVPPREGMPLAKAAALRALELDGGLAEAHTSLAYVTMAYDWDLEPAEREFQQAIRCNPGYATARHWHAHCLLAAGRLEEASAEMRQAQNLDPLSLPVNVGVGWCSYFARRYDDAINQYRKTLELEPNFALAHQTLGMALAQKHDYPKAIAEFQTALTLSGGASAAASLGYAYGLAGAKADARAQLARLLELSHHRYVPAIYMALVYLGLRDAPGFSSWLSKAREERSEYLIYYQFDPAFDAVRADPLFRVEPRAVGGGDSVGNL
jgi:TolB-like protein/DNA-binding winged helix-turn-helix (wHTH) protein/Tfp pilus assembly protein PilF